MRSVRSAICTSGEPVSVSVEPCFATMSALARERHDVCLPDGGRADPGGSIASRRSRMTSTDPARLRATSGRTQPVRIRRARSLAPRDHRHHRVDAGHASVRPARGARPRRPRRRPRRGRHAARSERVRQDDAAAAGRRSRAADRRHGSRSTAAPPPSARRAKRIGFVPQSPALLPVAHRRRQRAPAAATSTEPPTRRPARSASTSLDAVGLADFADCVPARTVGRHAAASRARPGVRARRAVPADGRTVRRTRRDHPGRHATPAGANCANRSTRRSCS